MSFNSGALLFKIQTLGASQAKQELREFDAAVKDTGKSAQETGTKVTAVGDATDQAGKKARDARGRFVSQADATKQVGDESGNAVPKQEKQKASTERQAAAARELSTALLAAGVALGAMVALSVAKYAQFDAQMSNVAAATMATTSEQKALADAALDAGAKTAYSATEAAAAEEELAKAGLSVSEIVGGSLNGALSLAAAGQLEVARSAEIMATTLKQYKLPAEQAAHVSDILAAGAGKAQGSVDDLALALTYVGPVAAGLKISLEETGGSLAYLASQGILGEKAGTGLRGVLMSLTAPSAIATKTMNEYGIEIFDSAGNMKSLAAVSQILHDRLGGLTEAERSAALGRIFGNEQITTARILYEGGAAAILKWTDEVNDSGYAAEQAAKRQDNLAGDIEKLGGAFDTALIRSGSGANDVLRDLVQGATALVDVMGELDPGVLTVGLTVAGAAASLLLMAGGAGKAVIAFSELKGASDALGIGLKGTALIAGSAVVALTGVLAIVGFLAQRQAEAAQRARSYADALEQGSDAAERFVAEQLTAEESWMWVSQGSAADAAAKFGISIETLRDAAKGNARALAEMSDVIKAGQGDQDAAGRLMEKYGMNLVEVSSASSRVSGALEKINTGMLDGKRIYEQRNRLTEESTTATQDNEAALKGLQGAAAAADVDIDKLSNTIRGFGSAQLDVNSATRDLEAAVDAVSEALATNGQNLDIGTEAGRDNSAALDAIARSAIDVAAATAVQTGSQEQASQALASGRQRLIEMLGQFGITGQAAEEYADRLGLIPSNIPTAVELIGVTAAELALQQLVRERVANIVVRSNLPDLNGAVSGSGRMGTFADGGHVKFFANGGHENHVAQMARAGDIRFWAEPETGGETCIPHAPSKRARSEQLLAETAAIFGGTYIPGGAARFADGGGYQAAPAAGATIREGDINIDVQAAPDMTGAELAHLIVGEIKWARRR